MPTLLILSLIAVIVGLAGIIVCSAFIYVSYQQIIADLKRRLESADAAYEKLDTEANALRKEVANLKACRKDLENAWDRLDD